MSEHIILESDKTETTDYLGVKHGVSHFEKREEIVRCRDCERFHTNTNGFDCPNLDSNGFCAWGERKEGGDD